MSTRTQFSDAMLAVVAGLEKLPKSYVLRRTTYKTNDNGDFTSKPDTRGMIWFTNKKAEACSYYADRTCAPGTICLLEAIAHHQKLSESGHMSAGAALGLTGGEIGTVVDVADSGRKRLREQYSDRHRALFRLFNAALRRRAERIGVEYVA